MFKDNLSNELFSIEIGDSDEELKLIESIKLKKYDDKDSTSVEERIKDLER